MNVNLVHCFFEQSGTFKKEFHKLGIPAIDYDICDDFGETDVAIDLFQEIDDCYRGTSSVFDDITPNDLIIAFFPCVRFCRNSILLLTGTNKSIIDKSDIDKLEYSMKVHNELNRLYCLVSKLVIVCKRKNLRLIIENPFDTQHYLTRYWPLKPALVDTDRTRNGDKYCKPTQFFFINCEPGKGFVFEPITEYYCKGIQDISGFQRSAISSEYASRFIRQFIID